MSIQFWIHHADQLLQREELFLHPALIPQEVLFLKVDDKSRPAVQGGGKIHTIRFMTSTKHQNVISSSPPITT